MAKFDRSQRKEEQLRQEEEKEARLAQAEAGMEGEPAAEPKKKTAGRLPKIFGKKNEAVQADAAAPAEAGKKKKRKKLGKMTRKQKLIRAGAAVFVLAAGAIAVRSRLARPAAADTVQTVNTAMAQRMDITSSLSSAGTISPKETYNVTSLVSGEVISADFSEGDQVEEGQVLYVIDSSSMETQLSSAQHSVERAQSSYDRAVEDYNQAQSDYSGNTYKSGKTGYIQTLYISAGDRVGANTQIADIYNNSVMKLRVPFLSSDAAGIGVGSQGTLTLTSTGEQLTGTVTAVANMEETLAGGRLVRYVTFEVANPGGLSESYSATAQVGGYLSAGEGTFAPTVDTVLTADLPVSVDVEALLVNEGDYISVGTPLFRMTADTAEDLMLNYEDAVDNAQSSLENAQSSLDNTQDNYDNYTITAPISGTVVTKNVNAGENVSTGNSATTLAVIYDLSELTFEMSVDELDISSVKTGQEVKVTADAFEGQTFQGVVTSVSMEGSYSSGVTNYPVTVTLLENGDLLPSMNVDGEIILDSAEDALVIPADALMRGNQVYVKDDSVTEPQGPAPAGFRAVQVETGLINEDYVEILSGLEEGDEVYVAESTVSGGFMMPGMGGMGGGMGDPGGMGGMGGGMGGPGGRP